MSGLELPKHAMQNVKHDGLGACLPSANFKNCHLRLNIDGKLAYKLLMACRQSILVTNRVMYKLN